MTGYSFNTSQYQFSPTMFTPNSNYGSVNYMPNYNFGNNTNFTPNFDYNYNSTMPYIGFGTSFTPSYTSTGSGSSSSSSKSTQSKNMSNVFKGLTKKEEKLITEYSTKKQEYVEDLGASLLFGTGLGLVIPNFSKVFHPFSAVNSAFNKNSVTNQLFKDVVKQDLWKKESILMQNAYAAMNSTEIRANKWNWQGLFKRGYTKDEFDFLQKQMKDALQRGNADEIAEVTMRLNNANSLNDGWFSKIKQKLFGAQAPAGAIHEYNATELQTINRKTNAVTDNLKAYKISTSTSFKDIHRESLNFKDATGKWNKMGIGFALLSLASEWKYISAGFKEDTGTGVQQLLQSVAKAGASWYGYILGNAIGKWGGAKLGAYIGTTLCPGLGTLIGTAAGFVCGSIGQWGLRKITNLIVGDNVANKYIAKNEIKNAKSNEEKTALIANLATQAQNDKEIDKDTATALAKAQQLYSMTA